MSEEKQDFDPGPLALAVGFEVASRADWMALVEEDIRPASVASLTTATADGISIRPIYSSDDRVGETAPGMPGLSPHTRGATLTGPAGGSWDVRALVSESGTIAANVAALDELASGSTSLLIDPTAVGLSSSEDLAAVLEGIHLEMAGVWIFPSPRFAEIARWLLDLWDRRGVPASDRRGGLGIDPLGVAARYGTPPEFSSDLAVLVAAATDAPGVRAITVDSTPYAEAGATEAWELAYSLATGVAYLRDLTEAGLGVDTALDSLAFTYSADTDQFTTISKLRAARRLWDRVATACGAEPTRRAQTQHALTSAAALARRDPWVNLLRNTVAAVSAGIGGAQAVTVRPFDSAAGRSDEFGRRTARNTQLLLTEEGNIGRVADAAGGSWYVEELTELLAETAWDRFRTVEASGGMAVVLRDGSAAAEVDAAWAAREARIVGGDQPVIGVSVHADPAEPPLEQVAPPPAAGPFPLRRRSAAFEVAPSDPAGAEESG